MATRQSNRPDRRLARADTLKPAELERIAASARYVGAAYHKLRPGNYGFVPPSNPRPHKALCDDLRPILRQEAANLLREGIIRGMVSQFEPERLPKYIWAVDEAGEVYEAKTAPVQETQYHGYRLGDNDPDMRAYILSEWKKRWMPG